MDPTTLFLVVVAVGLAGTLVSHSLGRDEADLRALELQALRAEERQRAALPAHVDPTDPAAIEAWKRARFTG